MKKLIIITIILASGLITKAQQRPPLPESLKFELKDKQVIKLDSASKVIESTLLNSPLPSDQVQYAIRLLQTALSPIWVQVNQAVAIEEKKVPPTTKKP